jgi:hypothetical protein
MQVEYNKDIHARAISIIEARNRHQRYEEDCLEAGLCAKCGNKLVTQPSETRWDAQGRLDETICSLCGHLAQLN